MINLVSSFFIVIFYIIQFECDESKHVLNMILLHLCIINICLLNSTGFVYAHVDFNFMTRM